MGRAWCGDNEARRHGCGAARAESQGWASLRGAGLSQEGKGQKGLTCGTEGPPRQG